MDMNTIKDLMAQADEVEKALLAGMSPEQKAAIESANAQFEKLMRETAGINSLDEMLNMTDEQVRAMNDRLTDMARERMGDAAYEEMSALEKEMRENSRFNAEKAPDDPDLTGEIKKHLRNAIYIDYETDVTDIPTGGTKFGGRPDVPADFEWFRNDEGSPLAFLAQFNLKEIHGYDRDNELPDSGMLYFFYDLENMPWDNLSPDENCLKVYYYDGEPSSLSPAEFPEDIDGECIVEQCGLSLEAVPDAPSWEDFGYVSGCSCDGYGVYASSAEEALGFDPYERGDMRFKLLGYGDIIQNSVLEEFDHGGESDWVLLAQFDTYENGNSYIMYCDGGRIYIGIKKSDLAAGNFDNARLVLQCF